VSVVAVDCDANKAIAGKYGVQGFPTIKLFGETKSSPIAYEGAREAPAIVNWALGQATSVVKARLSGKKSGGESGSKGSKPKAKPNTDSESGGKKHVITLTPDNFDSLVFSGETPWMVEYYAPWCGHCKNLAPEWAAAAESMAGDGVRFGAVDADKHKDLGARFGVKGFPTIKMFEASAKSDSDAKDYNGPRDASGLTAAAAKLAEASPSAPAITQIVSQAVWDEVCKKVCLAVVLPHILDDGASKRTARLDILKEVAGKLRGKPIKVVWWEIGTQEKMEVGLGASMPPQAFAVATEKAVFAAHKGAVDIKSLGDFAKSITGSIKGASPLPKSLDINSAFVASEPWDGKDGVAPKVDEDPLDL